jgi:OFA family oxalate/formate antiporter-like MFS transporter
MKGLNRWVYAVFGVIIMLLIGLIYAWSVFSRPIGESRPWSSTELSLTFTITMIAFCIGGLIAGFIMKKFSPRIIVIVSGILFFAGFMLASTTGDSPVSLYLGFGVIGGFASGISYNAAMSTMSKWFPDKQGLISGILLMGFGLSSFIIGKVYTAMSPSDGSDQWQNTFKIFAVVLLVVLVICSLFIVTPGDDYKPAVSPKKVTRQPASESTTGQMMKTPAFWCYYIWAIVLSGVGLVLVAQANGIATQVGADVSSGDIATVVGLISIFNGIGRIFFGALFDKKGHKITLLLCMAIFIVSALLLIGAINTGSFALIIIGFIVGGFAYGCVTPTNSAIISDFFGRKHYPINFPVINSNLIIASFFSTIAASLYDASGSYMSTIFMMIILVVVGFVVFFGIRRPKAKA